jgi:hypothetical protein
MKTICMAALVALLAAPALAGECGAWKAGIDMDEGGPTMVASICAAGQPEAWLSVTCGGKGKVGLRFEPATGDDFPPGGDLNYRPTLVFSSGPLKAEISVRYEAMDGALAARPNRDSDLVRVLKSAGPLAVADKAGRLPIATFSLKGSSQAIGKVERACHS